MSVEAVAAIAYALYDSENTSRLGEDAEAQEEYFDRAQKLLDAITSMRPLSERQAISAAILKSS